VPSPKAAVLPEGGRIEFKDGEAASQWLIKEQLISTVPWDESGAFLRFSVTFAGKGEEGEQRVLNEIKDRLAGVAFEF